MRKIFIVEDDRFITAIFTMFLRDLGHELVGKASLGREAIEKCKKLKPDVILMDIHLDGELDGIQTAEMLKREMEVPIIYISSDTSSPVIERAIVSNSYGYLVKPINKKELGISIDLAFYKHRVDLEQKEREQGYREFISNSPLPIVVLSKEKITYLNRLGLDIFKTHYIEDVMGMPIKNFVAEEFYEEFSHIIHSSISNDQSIKPFLTKMKTVHGDHYWVEIAGSKVNFNNHQSVQLIFRDVSAYKLSERKNQAYERALFEGENICFVLDNTYKIIRSNTFTSNTLAKETIVGQPFTSLINGTPQWLTELQNIDCKKHKGQRVEVTLCNGKTVKLNLNVVCSVNGVIDQILLT
ncbi:PAS domain S-box-containing protein [Saccharicrinis carchari]|uniref:PAS domain S-box-containing protein n=1 Tax=Saccharicrinis carchari TaxID=1168039 RepID=A0A521D6G2_SACCC|nr:response regulator [Saccharicrinis carchari]SMO66671.1 PAS domain S-box-containing protein [Saccharicrinis carchari]